MEKNFIHLHVHTEYSLLDGAARIKELVESAKNFGMGALAITDHGNMYGATDFYKRAKERGIKPIIGCEVYVAPASRFDRKAIEGKKNSHLVLLAENNVGYKNLIKLATLAGTEGFYNRPRVDKEILRKYHEGLIAMSACVAGEIPRAIRHDELDHARELILEHVEIFGRDNFFLEIQDHGLETERKVRDALKVFSEELKVELVATNDLHYVRREDAAFHDVLLCIQTNRTLRDEKRWKFPSDEYYLKTAEEMRELFSDTPQACDNTLKIAERCNVEIEFGKFYMPEFVGTGDKGLGTSSFLRKLCYEKLPTRCDTLTDEIKARLDYELKVIHDMGYDGYFLIVHDFINFARSKKIPVGPGRGSAAGSLVAYLLGITALDPLKYNLLFERFLNPERVTLPDIDVDLCYSRREEVIEYVRRRYGTLRVSQIATFGTLAAKAAIRDVVRVLGIVYSEGSRLISMLPNSPNITLEEALKKSSELRGEYETNPDSRRIIDLARKLEGLPRHLSVHAAGVVISKLPLDEIVPLQISNGTLVTQYDKDKVEELGLLKMDFLGSRTLTIIAQTLANIKTSRGVELELNKIPLCDAATAKMLAAGETLAIFQMESAGMTALVKELQPQCFEDLIPTLALYRPGPLGAGMVEKFIAGKRGRRITTYLHPKLEPILKETFGVILYQEQVMQIVQTLAGFTLGQADILRRAMSKKKADILLAQKENFLKGCESNGIEKILAEKIFELLAHFADYGFNKSHSAAYGLLAWQTAFLKAHYPAEYLAAAMSNTQDAEKIASYIELARRMKIKILPPDINLSESKFTTDSGSIRFGLSAIKTVNEEAMEEVIAERERKGRFKSMTNFCARVDLKNFTRHTMENLIKCGAFDGFNKNRIALLTSLDASRAEGARKHKDWKSGAISLFNDDDYLDEPPVLRDFSFKEILEWERDTLGFYVSGHPLEDFRDTVSNLISSRDILNGKYSGRRVKVGGLVTKVRRFITQRGGEWMSYIKLEDFDGEIDITIFPKLFRQTEKNTILNKKIVVAGRVVASDDSIKIYADSVTRLEDYEADFWLTIPARLNVPETFDILKEIFKAYSGGNSKVFVNIDGTWKKTVFQIFDNPTLRGTIINVLGEENVRRY